MVKAAKEKSGTLNSVWHALAVARIMIGFVFLWAFFDKLLGLGHATSAAKAWVVGGSPSTGFLMGVEGPFAEVFNTLAGQAWVDWLFMLGLLGIGVGLILGIAVRLSVVAGSILLFLMWLASLPIATNPFIDDHIVYIVILFAIGSGLDWQKWSLAGWWRKLTVVKKNAWLE